MTANKRILMVSDPHLSPSRAYYQDNWEMVLEWIERERPDFVVVGGDVVLTDPDIVEDHVFAKAQLSRIAVPWLVIPGNHDIGDNIVSGSTKHRVSTERRDRWVSLFGPDYWRTEQGDWTLIGVNAQIMNSQGLPAEAEQDRWLEETLGALPAERKIALFVHKPLFADHPSETVVHGTSLDLAGRTALMRHFSGKNLKLVACGHKHQYRCFGHDGVMHLWVPSTGCVNFKPDAKMWGRREVGFVELVLGERGVRQRLIGTDFLVRNESYIRMLEYHSMLNAPEQPAVAADPARQG